MSTMTNSFKVNEKINILVASLTRLKKDNLSCFGRKKNKKILKLSAFQLARSSDKKRQEVKKKRWQTNEQTEWLSFLLLTCQTNPKTIYQSQPAHI